MGKKCIKKIIAFTLAVALLISGLSNPAINSIFADAAGELAITSQPQDVTAPEGTSVSVSVEAQGSGLKYQWQLSDDSGKTWRDSTSASAVKSTMPFVMKETFNGRMMRCVITDAQGNKVTSDAITLRTGTDTEEITITSQPQDVTAPEGTSVSVSVAALGSGLKYQWQLSDDSGNTWRNSTSASAVKNTMPFVMKETFNGRMMRCVITDAQGNKVTSDAITLRTGTVTEELMITSQPQDVTAPEGTSVSVSVAALGSGLKYQWQLSDDGGNTWRNSTSASAVKNTMPFVMKETFNGRMMRCVITDAQGNKVTSDAITLRTGTVTEELTITSQPQDITALDGSSVSVSVEAQGSGLKYQWQLSDDSGKTWRDSTSANAVKSTMPFVMKETFNGRMMRCVITDVQGNKVISNAITLNIKVTETTEAQTTPVPTTQEETTTVGDQIIEVIGAVVNKVEGSVVTFAWGQSDEQINNGYKYNVYIDDVLYNTYDGAQTVEYTFATKGDHTITIKALYDGKESQGAILAVTTEEDAPIETTEEATTPQPTTEEATTEEITTPEPTTLQETTTEAGEQIIEVIGAVVQSVEGNVVTFAWGQNDEQIVNGYKYNVYIDNVFYNTYDGAATVAYAFATKGDHTITIKAFYNGKESAGAVLTATTESGSPETTEESTTPKQITTEAPSTAPVSQVVEVIGAVVQSVEGNAVSFAWGQNDEQINNQYKYNVYIDNVLYNTYDGATSVAYTFATKGDHTITIKALYGGTESQGVELQVTIESDSQVVTEAPTQASSALVYIYQDINYGGTVVELGLGEYRLSDLQAKGFSDNELSSLKVADGYQAVLYSDDNFAGTVKVITEDTSWIGDEFNDVTSSIKVQKAGTSVETETTTSASSTDFTTDTSIAQPFGLMVTSPENGYVNVVWGQGEINCYNVYVDGVRRRTGVKAASYLLPVYFEGTHTIAITTVVGTRESERVEATIAVVGVGEQETEPETCPPELQPQLRSDLSLKDDRILLQLNNKTDGKYSDSQVYWCLLGYNDANQLCYLDKDGNMIPASLGMNNVQVGDRMVADVSYTLAEADHVYVPSISSARMYLSYEKPIYITFNQAADGTIGFAGPDLNNPTDPNINTYFEFAEFTIDGKNYWGNTTRVDFFSFPMVTRLVGHTQYETYDKTVGDIGTRDEIFASFRNTAPAAFQSCVTDMRIICPCKSGFNEGMEYGNYFDAYINEFWTKYASEDLVFSSEAGAFTGRVVGDRMQFTRTGDSTIYYVDKPTTQDVLEGKGAFDNGNGVELAIEAQLCAAFNRGVATEPEKWYKPAEYYKNSINNFYAGFFHSHSIVGLAYGFCYDDVNDQSTLLQYDNADALIIDLKW